MADTAAPAAPTEVVLADPSPADADFSDRPGGDAPAGEQPQVDQAAKPEGEGDKPKISDAEREVLRLLGKTRQVDARAKALDKRELSLKGIEEENQGYRQLMASAKTDPLGFLAKIGEQAGLAYEDVVDAITAQRSGGEAKLPADHAVKTLQAEVQALKQQLEDKEKGQTEAQTKAANQAALRGHLDSIKGAAAATPDEFKLFNADVEANTIQAFDLMWALHQAGRPISHAEAVKRIEDVLREDTDKRAPLLGYQRASSTDEPARTTSPTTKTPATAPRAVAANAAPDVPASPIRSDEDIRNDWMRMTTGQH